MSGNSFGKIFTVTTAGESHGEALCCIVDGCPPNISLTESDIQVDLDRRRPGSTSYGTPRNEKDAVKILSGVFEGKTTGTPIALVIFNETQRSKDYGDIKDKFRPGHADFTYFNKYGIRDYRGGGRASARETAMRVAAGAIAKKVLKEKLGLVIDSAVTAIGPVSTNVYDPVFARENPFNFSDKDKVSEVKALMDDIIAKHDSCGAVVEVRAHHVPIGIGSPVFDRLDAKLAYAMMGINAVKGVEIGDGFLLSQTKGSESRDEITKDGFLSNHQGGILGGISTGQDIIVKLALKPTSSILIPGKTIDINGNETSIVTKGRHDPCVGIRAVSIAEAMMALVLLDLYMEHKAQCLW